mmetsp:Transcript_3989/g.7492  ORF Transcript_3989/g.7492 Transcript_3989/m.7492 type:complete len:563 (+) Transcript_3989:90-1778(+)
MLTITRASVKAFKATNKECLRRALSGTVCKANDLFEPCSTKIVSTIGPTSEQAPILQDLVHEGIRIMRLNFSHATVEEADLRITNLRNSKGRHGEVHSGDVPPSSKGILRCGSPGITGEGKNMRAVLLDTQGPEIRTTRLTNDHDGKQTVDLKIGDMVAVRSRVDGNDNANMSSLREIVVTLPEIGEALKAGNVILLDDGAVSLNVDSVVDSESVKCSVMNDGSIRSRVGVNLPGVKTSLPPMSSKDLIDIKYGVSNDVDFVAASFVRDAEGVRQIRGYIQETIDEICPGCRPPLIISKIENVEGWDNFDEILEESDGIMVARGDLGVEIPLESVTLAQKEMVAKCNEKGKPVIVATQMLESMTKNPRPTRAEVSDVTNAVMDGADAVMLSGETAKGKYVLETVRTMQQIIKTTEDFKRSGKGSNSRLSFKFDEHSPDCQFNSVAEAAVVAASASKAKAIIVLTKTGRTARLISSYRPDVPIVCYTGSHKVGRQLQIYRGCHPVVGLKHLEPASRGVEAIKLSKDLGFLDQGDSFVIVSAEVGIGGAPGGAAMLSMRVGSVE